MRFFIAALPIILLFFFMLGCKWSGLKSAVWALCSAMGLCLIPGLLADVPSVVDGGFVPMEIVAGSLAEGVLKAIFPIVLIIVGAIFSYNILVASGQIDVIKRQFLSLTDNKGILVLIMTWGFGGLLESMAGFGTAVAIPAAILIGLGYKPFFSAFVSLLANTVATGFGAVGVPVTTLCNEASATGHASQAMIQEVSTFSIVQLSPLFFLVPFTILMLTERTVWKQNIIIALWTGTVSLLVQYFSARFLGAETPAILGSVAAIMALVVAAKLSKSKNASKAGTFPNAAESLRAWAVYIIILALVLATGVLIPAVNHFLRTYAVTQFIIPMTGTEFKFCWIGNSAVLIFAGSIAGGLIQGLSMKKILTVLSRTVLSLRKTSFTIMALVSLASLMNHCGMIGTVAEGLVLVSGNYYPLFAPMIGAIGTFVTGSDTSSNILFAKLQVSVAQCLGMDGDISAGTVSGSQSNWLLASNTSGATGGKMISPQSIAIATAACEIKGEDDGLLLTALPYAVGYVLICGVTVFLGLLYG